MGKSLFEKLWDAHVVHKVEDGPSVLYIDWHFIHEVTSPQAFAGLEERGLAVFRPSKTIATADHNVPTLNQDLPIQNELSRNQVAKLEENCEKFGIELYGLGHDRQGIVHVIGPELGITQPGMTIVCGDSHTATHGAFGTISFGIGTSEVEQVLGTQCVLQSKPKSMQIRIDGKLQKGVTGKDVILYIISQLTASGGTGYFIEYCGSVIEALSMESRMTICNMSIEMGARGGLIAPDQTTFDYLKGRAFAPEETLWDAAVQRWQQLSSDEDAYFDKTIAFNAEDIEPMITYGTNPGMGIPINGLIPDVSDLSNEKSLSYMNLKGGETLLGKSVNYVFIGSCTNGRIEDLRDVARVVKGRRKAENVTALIVPGSKQVEKQAREEGIDKILEDAGFELRQPGCSACLAMNEDKIPPTEYCVSTSNRNFEGRQGPGARTLLASPLTAAATAINGYITDARDLMSE